jgi:hypothetical protein
MARIIVEVEGFLVTGVFSDDAKLAGQISILDHDDWTAAKDLDDKEELKRFKAMARDTRKLTRVY